MHGSPTTKEWKKKLSSRLVRWNKEIWPKWKNKSKLHRLELSNEETANLTDAEVKTLVIRVLTEMVEYGRKIEEKVKAMKSEIKENVQGTNSDEKERGTQVNGVEQKEEINIQPEWNAEKRIQKDEERLRNLQDNFKCSNIRIIGVPEGEEEEQEIENLFAKIMENFPSWQRK